MNVYITVGTFGYLKTIKEKNSQEKIVIMENDDTALLLHETEGETVFNEPRKYEVLDSSGSIGNEGFVVFNNIPVTDEGRPIFEYRFKNRSKQIENEPGFLAIRVLRPLSSNTYIVLTIWENEKAFSNWKNSPSFKGAHKNQEEAQPQPPIFSSPSYTTKYTLKE
jgi:heme-degrading monooxygenase HmoA